jgi:hypothetical protein
MIQRLFNFGGKPKTSLGDSNFKFLVVGAGRGGTSLLAALLDHHGALEVGFERFAVDMLMGKKIRSDTRAIYRTRVDAFVGSCIREAGRFRNRNWGNKITTEQLFGLEDHNTANPDDPLDVLDSFFNVDLKGIRVLFILRDGRTCVRSKMARTGQPLELACDRWLYSVAVYRFLKSRHHHSLCIKFEDLLQNPAAISTDICRFLGIGYRDSMLAGVGSNKMLPEYRQKSFDTSKLHLDAVPPGCLERIRGGLEYCGYL